MKACIKTILLSLAIILSSCSSSTIDSMTQIADRSYLYFRTTDNTDGQIFSFCIDDGTKMVLTADQVNSPSQNKILYQIPQGKHIIQVYKNNQLIVKKNVYIGNQETMEVVLP